MLTMTQFKKAAVAIEDSQIFAALVATPESGLPMAWNGWAYPYFDLKTAHLVVKEFEDVMRWKDGKIEIKDDHYDEEPLLVAPVLIDGEKYFCIGSGVMIWSECSTIFLRLPEYPSDEEIIEFLTTLAHGEYQYHIDDDPKDIVFIGGGMDGQNVFDEYEVGALTDNMKRIRNVMKWDRAWSIYAAAIAQVTPEKVA